MYESNASLNNLSTAKALSIFELIACSRTPLRLKNICESLSMNKSTALRFLTALTECGFILQEEDTLRYYPSFKICRLANLVSSHYELRTLAHPFLLALSEELNESVCLSVEQNEHMVYIDVVSRANGSLMSVQRVGNTSPMHCTGNGKLLLTEYSEEQIDGYIARQGLKKYTDHTITDKQGLLRELAQIREIGIAYDREECECGLSCIAAPIRNYTGLIIAGLSVTGPTGRICGEAFPHIQARLLECASQFSRRLGYEAE